MIGSGPGCAPFWHSALSAPRGLSAAWNVADAAAVGVVLLIFAFLRVTLFALAAAIVVTGCIVTPRMRRTWAGHAPQT